MFLCVHCAPPSHPMSQDPNLLSQGISWDRGMIGFRTNLARGCFLKLLVRIAVSHSLTICLSDGVSGIFLVQSPGTLSILFAR